jgi:hypothetical protein
MQNNDVFELSGKITFNDILKFQYFHCLRRIWWFVALLTTILFVILGVAAVVSVVFRSIEVARAALPIAGATLFWLAVVGGMPYLAARRQYSTMIALGKPVTFRFSYEGVHSVTGYSSGDVSWKAFWTIREAKTFFALHFSAGSAWILPKRFFADTSQQEKWRELVEAQIQPKKILKPGVVGKLL